MKQIPKGRKREKMGSTRYLMIAELVLKHLGSIDFPLYSNKFSKHDFTRHQLVVLLIVRQLEGGMSYKPFAERLKDLNRLTEFLGLKKLPSGSTLRKNADRIGNSWLNKILSSFAGDRHNIRVGVDSTGMQLQSSSNYYSEVLERHSKKEKRKSGRPAKRKIKKSQHFNVASDLDQQVILAVKSARGKRSDAKSMIPLLKKIKPISSQIGSVHADRGMPTQTTTSNTSPKNSTPSPSSN